MKASKTTNKEARLIEKQKEVLVENVLINMKQVSTRLAALVKNKDGDVDDQLKEITSIQRINNVAKRDIVAALKMEKKLAALAKNANKPK